MQIELNEKEEKQHKLPLPGCF